MIQITKVIDLTNDIIEVHGFDDAFPNKELVAQGWKSAMTNHFDPSSYGVDGHLLDSAVSRAMTSDECHAYWIKLLSELPDIKTPQPLLFQNPNAQAKLEEAQASVNVELINHHFESGNIEEKVPEEVTPEPTQETT